MLSRMLYSRTCSFCTLLTPCLITSSIMMASAFFSYSTISAMFRPGVFGFFFFQAEDGIRDYKVTGVQTCALPISSRARRAPPAPAVAPRTRVGGTNPLPRHVRAGAVQNLKGAGSREQGAGCCGAAEGTAPCSQLPAPQKYCVSPPFVYLCTNQP